MINIYNAIGNIPTNEYSVHEDTDTGLLQLVCNNSVIKSATPDRKANYADILTHKKELLTMVVGCLY